jgi:hypothetical protein
MNKYLWLLASGLCVIAVLGVLPAGVSSGGQPQEMPYTGEGRLGAQGGDCLSCHTDAGVEGQTCSECHPNYAAAHDRATAQAAPLETAEPPLMPTPEVTWTPAPLPAPTETTQAASPHGGGTAVDLSSERPDDQYTGPIAEYAAAEQRENQPGNQSPRTARVTQYMGLLVEVNTDEENRPFMEFLDGMRVYVDERGVPTEPVSPDWDSPFVECAVDAEAVSDYAEEVVEDLHSLVEAGGEIVVGSADEPEWSEAQQELSETLESRLITESEEVPEEDVRAMQAETALMAVKAELNAASDELKPSLDQLDAERQLTDSELLNEIYRIQQRFDEIAEELDPVRESVISDWVDEYAEEIKSRLPGVGPPLDRFVREWKQAHLEDLGTDSLGQQSWLFPENPADFRTVDALKSDFQTFTIGLLEEYSSKRRLEYGPDDRELESALELMRFLGWASHITATGGGGAVDRAAGFVERFDTYRSYQDAVMNDPTLAQEHQPPPGWGLWGEQVRGGE